MAGQRPTFYHCATPPTLVPDILPTKQPIWDRRGMLESKAKVKASLASAHSRASVLGSDASVERAARASRRNRVDDDSLHVCHTAQIACNAWRSQQRHSSWTEVSPVGCLLRRPASHRRSRGVLIAATPPATVESAGRLTGECCGSD